MGSVRIEGLDRLVRQLARKKQMAIGGTVIVGYSASYALFVHENLRMRHKPGKQAKFLTDPIRWVTDAMRKDVYDAVRRGLSLLDGLLLAGLRLQRESQKVVPVKTGNLRASAFTRIQR